MRTDIAIIGGGPAGLAAAAAAYEAGVRDLMIIERNSEPGGILNQCIHNGFGLHTFHEELTGPEYASRYIRQVRERNIKILLDTMVIDIEERETVPDTTMDSGEQRKRITAMSRERGMFVIEAKAVILAMGCRERPRGALNLPGYRPAGIYTAGTAQRFVNIEGRMPGQKIVILGSGDIGLIMARRMTWEGAQVLCVAEVMPFSGGLKRNIVQCLNDYGIPLLLSHTVVDIRGRDRVESVVIAEVNEKRQPIPGTEVEYECDTLLLSCGLIPENELSAQAGVRLNPATSGPVVGENLETSVPGIFACGNVLHVHDLVDYVSEEAERAGRNAAAYVMGSQVQAAKGRVNILCGQGVRYTVPSYIYHQENCEHGTEESVRIRFRVTEEFHDGAIVVRAGNTEIRRKRKKWMAPGEMEEIVLTKAGIPENGGEEIVVEIDREDSGK